MTDQIAFDVIISTCNSYCDLWDGHIMLMNRNWKAHGAAYLVTDVPTERTFDGVEVICAGAGTEITQRLKLALERVRTKYILFTMDDYYLTKPIDNQALQQSLAVMEAENLDYLRLFPRTKAGIRREKAVELKHHKGYYLRNVSEGNYKISLYPGLWRTDFMRKTLQGKLNAWQYEVALTPMANQLHARCAISNRGEFPFLDVVRKGKLLRRANRYFSRDPVYCSQRPVMTVGEEWKLGIQVLLSQCLPKPLFQQLKRFLIRCGMEFYSPV